VFAPGWLALAWLVLAIVPVQAADPVRGAGYLVIDLSTGRELAASHPDWLDTPVSPGSIAKVATLASALAAKTIDADTRIACSRRLRLPDGRSADCSHPPLPRPPDVSDALSQSCNSFVAAVARRMSRSRLSAGHVALGLPPIGPEEDLVSAAIGMGSGRIAPRRLPELLRRAVAGAAPMATGLARAADSGTAAAFGRAGIEAYAKTGTARMPGGATIGLVAALLPRERPARAIVVLVPGGSGADAAEVGAVLARQHAGGTAAAQAGFEPRIGTPREAGGYDVRAIPLEDYVAQVVAGEVLRSTPAAAREAVAVAARTFAWANRGRHRLEGFDLCTLTHCQVVRPAYAETRDAAAKTLSLVLTADGLPAHVFYSAACGGTLDAMGAIATPVEPGRERAWMRARPDPAGVQEPTWTSVLTIKALEDVFEHAGWRGRGLRDLRVESDSTGRARRVYLEGLAPPVVPVNDFRRLVGQRLGWHLVKSTAFVARRTAAGFELRGRGSGHGVGLCLFGAEALARRGLDREAILAAYFEGLTVSRLESIQDATAVAIPTAAAVPAPVVAASLRPPPPARAQPPVIVDLRVPETAARDAEEVRAIVVRAVPELARTLRVAAPPRVALVMHPTADSYRRATAREWWTSAATVWRDGGATIHTVPPGVLRRTGQLESTLRHELVHLLADATHADRPLWFREGVAIQASGTRLDPLEGPCPADHELSRPSTPAALGRAYRRALYCVMRQQP
jgi:SpoIID/LytB domain protein